MSEEGFREIFRRITSETPDAPAFADLEAHQVVPRRSQWAKPWMVGVGAAAAVLLVVGGFGILGSRGPDLAGPSLSTTTLETSPAYPADCPVTIPDGSFTPPGSYPDEPAWLGGEWHGTDGLWTALSSDGVYTPRKSVWWSISFPGGDVEEQPELSVTWELLNSERTLTVHSDRATNAYTDEDGWFVIAGVDPEIRGCWRATAVYKGATLSYVYYNGYFDDPATTLPDVVGKTVSEASSILESRGYVAAFHDSSNPTYEVCAQEPGAGVEVEPGAIVGMRTAVPGGCEDLMNPGSTLSLNPDYLTYEDEFGRTWYATACPNADVMIGGGAGAADALPEKGQTSRERVVGLFESDQVPNIADGTISFEVVPRNGEGWFIDDDGEVAVEDLDDVMVEAKLSRQAPCPSSPYVWNGVPVAYIRESGPGGLCPDEPTLGSAQVMVFFDCGDGDEPNPIGFARPLHPEAPDRITSVFWHMLTGPSVNERGRGSGSFFSEESSAALISTDLTGDHLIVDFNEDVLVDNASTSTGSLFFLSELVSNAFSVDEVGSVEFRVNGSCEDFWAFLQAGDDVCTIIDRP